MTFSKLHKSAINNALKHGLNFAIFRDKNSEELIFICDDNSSSKTLSNRKFFAVNWLGRFNGRTTINDRLSLQQAADYTSDYDYNLQDPYAQSTDHDDYVSNISNLIFELSPEDGKVVISRTIAFNSNNDIAEIADKYFAKSKSAYCCLLHTPAMGCWLIASPELLLEADYGSNTVHTIALAGTRKAYSIEAWDKKNIREQRIVRDYIVETFNNLHIKCDISETSTLRSNNIEHLATFISGKIESRDDVETIIDTLNPTPALCGLPQDKAIEAINKIEKHPRRLYGGYFGLTDENKFKAIVTLRCAQLSTTKTCIYAGGGITSESDPELEWNETTLKSQVIANIITEYKS